MATINLGQTLAPTFDGSEVKEITLNSSTIWKEWQGPRLDKLCWRWDPDDYACYSGSGTSAEQLAFHAWDGSNLDCHNYTLYQGVTHSTSLGGYFDFDGTNDYIAHTEYNSTQFDTSSGITVSGWFLSDTSHNGVVFSIDSYPNRMMQIKKKSNGTFGPVFLTGGSGSTNQNKFTSGWSNSTWYHYVVIYGPYSGSAPTKVYQNNVLHSDSTTSINMANANPYVTLGRQRPDGSSGYFNGKIGKHAFWEVALSEANVQTIWDLEKADYGF